MATQDLGLSMLTQEDNHSSDQHKPAAQPICYLLDRLPAEMRNRIYRAVLLIKDDVQVDSTYSTPGLLQINQQIRAEASSIYYLENTFTFHSPDYSCCNQLKFLQTGAAKYLGHDTPADRYDIAIADNFNFENMVEWLKHESEGNVLGYFDVIPSDGQATIAAANAFELVKSVCGALEWKEIVKMLKAYKLAMEAIGVW